MVIASKKKRAARKPAPSSKRKPAAKKAEHLHSLRFDKRQIAGTRR